MISLKASKERNLSLRWDSSVLKRYKSDEIADVLRLEIEGGRYRVGECLPSVDELRCRFGVGEFAVRSAFHKLRDEGLVSVTKHVGVTVAEKVARIWKGQIVFVHSSKAGSYFPHKLSMQLASRFEAAGWGMHSVFLEANEDGCIDTETLECHISGGLAFAVVLSEFRQITELLDRASVPYVVVDGYTREFPNARAVIRDSKSECYAELVNYMKASGMKTMLEIDYERRMDRAFKKLLADSGIIVRRELCRFDNETIHQLSDVREIGFNAVSRFLSGNKRQLPDIVLFDDDYLAAGGVLAIFKAGLRIPDDIAVATHSNKGDEMLIGVPHCRIENDPASQGDIIAKYVLMLLDGHDARPPCNKLRFLTIS